MRCTTRRAPGRPQGVLHRLDTAVGRSILVAASTRIASVSLELGGKSAQIVFPDVDEDVVAEGIISAMRFTRQGQSCTAGSRLYVHEDIADSFLARLIDRSSSCGSETRWTRAPTWARSVNERQFDRVCYYVERGDGAESGFAAGWVACHRRRPAHKWVFRRADGLPQPAEDDAHDPRGGLRSGPVRHDLARGGGRDREANDSDYGLAGYVWCKAGAPALRVAHALEAGG